MNYSILEHALKLLSSNRDYSSDYSKKVKNGNYDGMIDYDSQFDIRDIYNFLSQNDLINKLIAESKDINYRVLFNSFVHGHMHNERVLFNIYLISVMENSSDDDLKILMDACKYHDIGRMNDMVDDLHGLVGANKIESVVKKDPFYTRDENLNMLKLTIDFHSSDDSRLELLLETYDIKDVSRATNIAKRLKDADALDRVRLTMGRNFSELNPSMLRLDSSKRMVKLTHQLNELYLSYLRSKSGDSIFENLESLYGDDLCFHGIGFDIFKLESIIQNGILSCNELENNNIDVPRNYVGVNFKDFVCVSCYGSEYYSPKRAFNNFISDRISFCMTDLDLIEGRKISDYDVSEFDFSKMSIPLDREVFSDERFVKDRIPKEKIKSVVIPRKLLNCNFRNVVYMNNGFSQDLIVSKTLYYIKNIEDRLGEKIDRTHLDLCFAEVGEINKKYENSLTKEPRKYMQAINSQLFIINDCIGILMEQFFRKITGKENVTFEDAINYVAENNGLQINTQDSEYITFSQREYRKN